MRVLYTRNYHVPINERSRRMYKRDHEYDVPDEVGKAIIGAKRGKMVAQLDETLKGAAGMPGVQNGSR